MISTWFVLHAILPLPHQCSWQSSSQAARGITLAAGSFMSCVTLAEICLLGGYLLDRLPISRWPSGISGVIIGMHNLLESPCFCTRKSGFEGELLCRRSDSINKDWCVFWVRSGRPHKKEKVTCCISHWQGAGRVPAPAQKEQFCLQLPGLHSYHQYNSHCYTFCIKKMGPHWVSQGKTNDGVWWVTLHAAEPAHGQTQPQPQAGS